MAVGNVLLRGQRKNGVALAVGDGFALGNVGDAGNYIVAEPHEQSIDFHGKSSFFGTFRLPLLFLVYHAQIIKSFYVIYILINKC